MEKELLQLVMIAVVIAPIVTGFTELYKRYTPAKGKLLPILSILTAIVLSVIWAVAFKHTDLVGIYALSGLLSGLSAVGVYQLTRPKEDK